MVNFKTSTGQPDIYPLLNKKFGVEWDNGVIITYGDTVHCKYHIPADKIIHENVHVKQQTDYGVKAWWDRYFIEEKFRLSQELEAYKAEAKFIKNNIKDRNGRYMFIHQMAKELSSSMYGNIITLDQALKELL
jgi:hypothetical protein